MKVSTLRYEGSLQSTAVHESSGVLIRSDAPVDNQGLGQNFSPTDLCATALGTCMFTIMGIKAREKGWNLEGMKADVHKTMTSDPRRIIAIRIDVHMPKGPWSQESRQILERVARTCPVALSLHPDIEQELNLLWTD